MTSFVKSMHKKNILNSPRLLEIKKKKKRVIRNRIIFILVCILVLFIALCFISRIPKLNIKSVVIEGNKIIDTKDIEKNVNESMAGYYLYFLPKTNFILLPKDKIKRELENTYKRLKDIEVKIKANRILEITVGERTGVYTWCGVGLPDVGTKPEENKCYFMDDNGYIFDEAPYFSNDVYLKFFGAINASEPAGAKYLIDDFTSIVNFIENISNEDINPSSIFMKDSGEIDIYLSGGKLPPNAPKIILNNDADLIKMAENFQASASTDPLQTELKEKYELLEYIDLRFGNRVYYRFRQ